MTVTQLIEAARNHKPTPEQEKEFWDRVREAEAEMWREYERQQRIVNSPEFLNRVYDL